jgi:hypothetical protein
MSDGIDWDSLPVAIKGDDAEIRKGDFGGISICLLKLDKGHDTRPIFRGLPGDLCQIPHWGYIVHGSIRLWTETEPKIFNTGDAFYWAPGHAPEALEDTEYVEMSPAEQYNELIKHLSGD